MSSSTEPVVSFEQSFRPELLARVKAIEEHGHLLVHTDREGGTFVKTARIVALRIATPFIVQTDRGPMRGQKGDWLVTNHPDDDEGSDIWSISDARMRSTYSTAREVEDLQAALEEDALRVGRADDAEALRIIMIRLMGRRDATDRAAPAGRHLSLAITHIEDAISRVEAAG